MYEAEQKELEKKENKLGAENIKFEKKMHKFKNEKNEFDDKILVYKCSNIIIYLLFTVILLEYYILIN